jgi:nicotinamidase/pyrazinamidase
MREALVLVDLQNDFMPGGARAVPDGNEVVPVANRLQDRFDLVLATQDWHPPDHGSFAASHPGRQPGETIELEGLQQVLWPVHCVEGTRGAAFHDELSTAKIERVFRKGTDRGIDSYSGFFNNAHRKATGLGDFLVERRVESVCVMGLATDYCVKFTALDAIKLGFACRVVGDGCRGVELAPGDVQRALDEMREAGVEIVEATDL